MVHGVNLGGWLVLEKWMTPDLFEGTSAIDESTYCRQATLSQLARLRTHRETYITEADFQWLAAQGINAVRLPVGYWLFGDAKPFLGTVEYVDRAFKWAEAHGIRILLSLHGAPGSQNGNDHSGCVGPTAWADDPANVQRTLDTVRQLCERYKGSPALLGICLLNEPSSKLPKPVLKGFYKHGYRIVREVCGPDVWVVISDGFQPWRWQLVLHRLGYHNVYLDTHQYFVFDERHKRTTAATLLARLRWRLPAKLAWMRLHHPVIVGEWSAALDAGSLAGLTPEQRLQAYQDWGLAQRSAYDRTDGWFFWSYKTAANGDGWSYRDCRHRGWL